MEDLGLSPEAIEQALASSGRNFDDSDSETDENASTSLLEESQESGVESDSDAASELAIFQVNFVSLSLSKFKMVLDLKGMTFFANDFFGYNFVSFTDLNSKRDHSSIGYFPGKFLLPCSFIGPKLFLTRPNWF